MAAPVEACVVVARRASFETRGAANDNSRLRLVSNNGNLTAATGLPNTVFSYDVGTNGKGRLTGLSDMSGTMSWTYDGLGRLLTQVQNVTGAATRTISYSYNGLGQLASMTYPSGKVVAYSYNSNGQASGITLNGANLITGITYQPFGGVKGWTWGNGTAYARTYDLDGRLLSYPLGSRTRTLTYDNAGRITAYTDSNSAYSQSFGYDANDRLTSWTGGWGISESYSYDANGNRRTVSITGQTLATLVYPTTNNKFTGQGGGNMPFTPSYDATGNMTAINNGITLVYDGRNRVASSTGGGITTNYWVNGLGQRVRKTWNGSTVSHVLFTYAPDGKHIGSYDLNGTLTEETIFLGDTPIAVVTGAGTFNLYADHINAIRQITNQTNQTRWSWEQTNAFGSTLPNQNPAGLGTFNYRRGFPGQFYDAELLTWNNGFRTYHAGLGRYLQPDPIGLKGGDASMFGYVLGNPVSFTDQKGLQAGGFECWASCVNSLNPLDLQSALTLTALGGTFPKSAVGLPSSLLGGESPMTTVPSYLAFKFCPRTLLGGAARSVGRLFSPVWIGYGLYMAGAEVYCAGKCLMVIPSADLSPNSKLAPSPNANRNKSGEQQ